MFTVESPISFQIWHAQHSQSSKFSPSSGGLDKKVSQKPWSLMGEGKRHHCLSCGQPKANASPSGQLFQGRLCPVLVCWNKLALFEGQKWQRMQRWKSPTPKPHICQNQEEQRGQGHLAEQKAGAMGERKFMNCHDEWCPKAETVEYLLLFKLED